jgi:hypothetical protein
LPLADATRTQLRTTRRSVAPTRPRTNPIRAALASLPERQYGPTTRTVRTTPAQSRRIGKRRRRQKEQTARVGRNREFGPRSGPVEYTPRRSELVGLEARVQNAQRRLGERSDMPAASLRTDAALDYQMRRAETQSTRSDLRQAAGALEGLAEIFTLGTPSMIRLARENPSPFNVGMAIAGVFPFTSAAKIIGKSVRAGRYGASGFRVLEAGGQEAVVTAARSWLGRSGENLYWNLTPHPLKVRRVAKEQRRIADTMTRVQTSAGKSLRRLGKTFRADQQVALRLWAEGKSVQEQLGFYRRMADEATDAAERTYHQIHVNLIEQASKYLGHTTDGAPTITGVGKRGKQLQQASRLLEAAQYTREDIYKSLGLITHERIAQRLHAPGRVVGGAEWREAVRVADDVAGEGVIPGTLVGEEAFEGGRVYVPGKRGTPGVALRPSANIARQAQAFVNGGWRRSIGQMSRDPSLTKAFTGALMESGFFRTDVTNLASDALAKATKIARVHNLRTQLLRGAVDEVPLGKIDDYIAIKVDPRLGASEEMKMFWDKYELLGSAGLSHKQLEEALGEIAPEGAVQNMTRSLFPRTVTAGDPNIKWVPRGAVDAAVLNPIRSTKQLDFAGEHWAAKILGGGIDMYNDLVRASILYLNPAYGPVNFLGNSVMALFQQGVLLPRNIAVAAKWAWSGKITPENLAAIRDLIQVGGLTGAIGKSRTLGTRSITGAVADGVSFFADHGPRWTAFVHEAKRAGIKNERELNELFDAARRGHKDAVQKTHIIKQKTNRALVDFENLSEFERRIVTRGVFFYPWLKGAAVWTKDFAKDHPLLAGGAAAGLYAQDKYSDSILGDRPWYAQFDTPIPGMEDERGNPYVMNPRQLFTPYTPLENAATLGAFALGKTTDEGYPQLMGNLTPGLQNTITMFTGRNEFGQEVGQGPMTLLRETYKDLPPYRIYKNLTTPYEDKQDRLYPRTDEDERNRIVLGGLAWKPYNVRVGREKSGKDARTTNIGDGELTVEEGQRLANRGTGEQSTRKSLEYRRGLERLNEFPGNVDAAKRAWTVMYNLQQSLDSDPKVYTGRHGKLNPWAASRVLLSYVTKLFPDNSAYIRKNYRNANTSEKRRKWYDDVREAIRAEVGWSEVNKWLEEQDAAAE